MDDDTLTVPVTHLSVGKGGWVRCHAVGSDIYVRVVDRDDRLVPVELFLADYAGLTTRGLGELPLRRIEALANEPGVVEHIRYGLCEPGPDLGTAAKYFATSFGADHERIYPRHWAREMAWAQHPEGGVDPLPDVPKTDIKPDASRKLSLKLPVPPGKPHPDEFYEAVAQLYSALAGVETGADRGPAPIIAKANGVPVTTARGWVKEARRRGFLGRGAVGRAG